MVKVSRSLALLMVVVAVAVGTPAGNDQAWAQSLTVNVPLNAVDIVELIENSVPGLTTVTVYTVPDGHLLFITDLVISNSSDNPASSQRVFRDNSAATAFITVPPQSTFSHTWATGLIFTGGQTVAVRNGTSTAGSTHFYLRGYLATF